MVYFFFLWLYHFPLWGQGRWERTVYYFLSVWRRARTVEAPWPGTFTLLHTSHISSSLGILREEGGFNMHFPHHIKLLFLCLLASHNPLNCLIILFASFSIGLFVFFLWIFKYFPQVWYFFNFVDGLCCHQRFTLLLSNLSSFLSCIFYVILRNSSPL